MTNKEYYKAYREKNKNNINARRKAWRNENKIKISAKNRIYEKEKRLKNIQFRLSCNLRRRLCHIVRGTVKRGSAIKDLGCSVNELKIYLESLFQPGMSWQNYGNKVGNWSIDHIIPLSRVNLEDRKEFLKVNHYTNLQPMWHIDNIRKSNKIHTEELNKYY
jgi:hypothetical protein